MPSVACIIVNYNAADLVLQALPAVLADLRALSGSHLFLVDNASPEGDAARLRPVLDAEEDATLIAHHANDGFAAGNNVGFAAMEAREAESGVRFDYVFLLNPDAWPEPGATAALVAFAEAKPDASLFGPRITEANGEPHWSAYTFPSVAGDLEARCAFGLVTAALSPWRVAKPPRAESHETDWLSGAALLLRRDVVETLGPMDEGYFLYFEETDYQLAAHRAGCAAWYVPEARFVHLQGQSTGLVARPAERPPLPDYWFRSRRRYFEKNHGAAYADRADRAWLWGSRLFLAKQKLLGRSDHGRADAIERFLANRGRTGQGRPGEPA